MAAIVDKLFNRWRSGILAQVHDLGRIPRPGFGDLVGGVSVALLLIPQSLAYAGLAGLPPYIGLFAAAFPLIAFSLLASSPYLQTGPVALTSLLTAGALAGAGLEAETAQYIAAAALLALIVGVTRLAIGALRLGSVVYLMSEPVMIGFTSGAGIVILTSQLPKALGVTLPENIAEIDNPIVRAAWSVVNPDEWGLAAIVMSVVTLVLLLRGRKWHRLFPGVLVALLFALAYSSFADYGGPVVGEIEAGIPGWSLDLPWSSTGSLVVGGLVIALVGFAEPASIARTFANEDQSHWSSSREFIASGLANGAAALTGAFPVGGSFSRSSINRLAGAQTRWSGAVTGLVVLAFLPFAGLLKSLPQAVLGAIVVGAVFGLIRPTRLFGLARRSPLQGGLGWATFLATLVTPPNVQWAVLFGIALTVLLHFFRRFHLEMPDAPDGELHLRPRGLLWVATTTRLKTELRRLILEDGGSGVVVVNLDRCTALDAAIADSIAAGRSVAEAEGRDFRVINAPDGGRALLENFDLVVK